MVAGATRSTTRRLIPLRAKPQGLVGAIFDVTARARAEMALRESEERFRAVVDSANEGMLIYDRSLNIIAGNRAAERIVGLPLGAADRQAGLHLAAAAASARTARRSPEPSGRRASRCAPASRRPGCASASSAPAARDLAVGQHRVPAPASTRPTTTAWSRPSPTSPSRRNAEARLKESEARFRRTFELAGSGIAHIGMDRRFIRVNRRLCEILGYSEEEMLRLTGRQISHPDDLDIINEQRPALHAGEIDAVRLEKRYLRKDGSVVWVKFSMTVERDADGKPLYEIAVYDDITAQREAEARLKESEARFRQTFELAASGICHVVDGRFVRVNRSLCEILGYPEKELLGKHGEGGVAPRGPRRHRRRARAHPRRRDRLGALREALPARGRQRGVVRPRHRAGARRVRHAAVRDRGVRRHHRAQERRGRAAARRTRS